MTIPKPRKKKVVKVMSFDEWEAHWMATFRAQGHSPVMHGDDPEWVDKFVTEGGFHNGPGCKTCGWTTCYHCTPASEIPKCTAITPITSRGRK
jgi:hypothetical protein